MQSVRTPGDKKLPWRLNVNLGLFGLLSETNFFPMATFFFYILRRGESKGHRILWEVKQIDVQRETFIFSQTRPQMI